MPQEKILFFLQEERPGGATGNRGADHGAGLERLPREPKEDAPEVVGGDRRAVGYPRIARQWMESM
ncbi:hypothetical protein, partial [Frankia sp. Cj3]